MEDKRKSGFDWEIKQQEEDARDTAAMEREKFQQQENTKETARIEREKQEQARKQQEKESNSKKK
jgi:hypothetical protein